MPAIVMPQDYLDSSVLCPYGNVDATVNVTVNALNIEGVLGYGFDGYKVPTEQMVFMGSFFDEVEKTEQSRIWKCNDESSDVFIAIPFTGNGLQFSMQSGNAAGVIRCQVDGKTVLDCDLYDSKLVQGGRGVQLWPLGVEKRGKASEEYGQHLAVIFLVGVNPLAGKPTAGNHRFAIQEVYAIDAR
jgi:hypothetical protein